MQQIGGHYSQFKKIMQLKSWKAPKQQGYELQYDDSFPSDTDSDAYMVVGMCELQGGYIAFCVAIARSFGGEK